MFGRGKNQPYRIGLALSGGGARGFAHAGALQALLDCGLKPDIIAGVSAGSVVASLYSAGMSPREILDIFRTAKFTDFCQISTPKDGFFKLTGFKAFLRKHIHERTIEEMPVPLVVCATDLDHGTRVAFDHGPVVDAVVASCSIPIVFKPVRIGGVNYVDGGVMANLPAWAIRDKCRLLIGINCSPLTSRHRGQGLIDIALRSYELMSKNNASYDMSLCDILIKTDEIADHKVFDLKNIDRVFDSGYHDTMSFLAARGIGRR